MQALRGKAGAAGICLLLALSLLGCGGGGGGPSGPPTISGTVSAPSGTPVAARPSLWQRLASLFVSPAEAQALTGQAVAGATIRAFLWPNVPPSTTTPIATTSTDSQGRYTLELPAEAAGKDLVLIATKSVSGGELRLSYFLADVPAQGQAGVNLDAVTSLATEQIVKVARDQNIPDLSPNAIATIVAQVREVVSSLTSLNLVAGAADSPLPADFGQGLQRPQPPQVAQVVEQVQGTVEQQRPNLPPSTGNVAIAKGVVQMLRDFGMNLVGVGDNEVVTLQRVLEEQQRVIHEEIQVAEDFAQRMEFPIRVLNSLQGRRYGLFEEVAVNGEPVLDRVGEGPNNRTWQVTSKVGATNGMVLTITTQNPPMDGVFFLDPRAGTYTLQVRKPDDAALQYDGTLQPTLDAQGRPTRIALNITLRDRALASPITFSGTLSGTPASGSTLEEPDYTQATFSGSLSSQFGTVQVGSLRVETTQIMGPWGPERVPQRIVLQDLRVSTQTSKPVSLTLSGTVEQEPTPQQWQEVWGDMMPRSGTITATLQGSGITLSVRNAQVSDFVILAPQNPWEKGQPFPRRLSGGVSYTSPSLTFNGTAEAFWESPGASGAERLRGTLTLQGDWTPRVGIPGRVSIQGNSTSQGLQITLNLTHGTQALQGTFTGRWDVEEVGAIQEGTLSLTHSPSGFRVQLGGQKDQPPTGSITTAAGEKVADIGGARNLGLAELGEEPIVKYTDNSFETLKSILPRVSRR